jgi:hypothetical protein
MAQFMGSTPNSRQRALVHEEERSAAASICAAMPRMEIRRLAWTPGAASGELLQIVGE